jgi:LemA protein
MNLGKGTIIGLSIVVLLAFFGMYGCNKRNSFIDKEEQVKAQWQQVENQYQRRLDLIPNIVATVEGQAKFEKETLKEVVEARAAATKVSLNVDNLNEESIAKYQKVQGELSSALSRLLMVTENYPELKANQAFSDLRVELEGCENRISEERRKFNESAKDFNASIRKIPGSLFAWGFEKASYFQAEEGAEKAPKVKFNI